MNHLAKYLHNKFFESVDKSINDKLTMKYGGIPMQEFTFEITHIYSEKRINGVSNIGATCIQDKMMLDIEISNSKLIDKNYIKQELINKHALLLEIEDKHKNDISVGAIL